MDKDKQEILDVLKVTMINYPQLRVGQIIENALINSGELYYLPDYVLLDKLKEVLKRYKEEGVKNE